MYRSREESSNDAELIGDSTPDLDFAEAIGTGRKDGKLAIS